VQDNQRVTRPGAISKVIEVDDFSGDVGGKVISADISPIVPGVIGK
jgi:hypothetical protein